MAPFVLLFSLSVYSPSLANVKPLSHFANDFVIWTLFFPFLWFLILSVFQKYRASDISSVRKETFMPFVWYLPFFFLFEGVYWIDPNGGISIDAIEVHCEFKKNASCLYPSEDGKVEGRWWHNCISYSLMAACERNKGRKMYTSVWKL